MTKGAIALHCSFSALCSVSWNWCWAQKAPQTVIFIDSIIYWRIWTENGTNEYLATDAAEMAMGCRAQQGQKMLGKKENFETNINVWTGCEYVAHLPPGILCCETTQSGTWMSGCWTDWLLGTTKTNVGIIRVISTMNRDLRNEGGHCKREHNFFSFSAVCLLCSLPRGFKSLQMQIRLSRSCSQSSKWQHHLSREEAVMGSDRESFRCLQQVGKVDLSGALNDSTTQSLPTQSCPTRPLPTEKPSTTQPLPIQPLFTRPIFSKYSRPRL